MTFVYKSEYTKAEIEANIKLWLEALESGKYKQTRDKLRSRNGGMCCLGVGCEVLEVEREWTGASYTYKVQDNSPSSGWIENDLVLPSPVKEALGLLFDSGDHDPISPYGDQYTYNRNSLASLNDDAKYTFKQIAEVIRSKPPGLFKEDYNID